jgi:hypothetical protein
MPNLIDIHKPLTIQPQRLGTCRFIGSKTGGKVLTRGKGDMLTIERIPPP